MIKPTLNVYPYTQMVPPFVGSKQTLIRQLIKIRGSQGAVLMALKAVLVILIFYIFRDIVFSVLRAGCQQLV